MTRTVVLISGSGSNLQAFIDGVANDSLPLDLALVISNQASAHGLKRAEQAGIDTTLIEHTAYASRQEFDQALMRAIDGVDAQLVILAGFMRILTEGFVNHYQGRLINIHPSLLPKYPGTNTHQRALDAGDSHHGATVHFVVPEGDAGPIIVQGQMSIYANDTAQSLQQRIHKIEHQIYPLAARWFAQNRLSVENDQVLLDGENSVSQLQSFEV
jgi:phosphoribosylglycinamide formyltransferase, formyltetrahydrofolate-dependent